MKINSRPSFLKSLFLIVLFFGLISAFAALTLLSVHAQTGSSPYFHESTIQRNGKNITRYTIGGPPHPPAGYEVRALAATPQPGQFLASQNLTDVPAFDWVFGCSSVSGAMIAGYYDRNGFPNMYTGPTGGGVTPLDNSVWGTWSDGVETYPNIPLAASHQGVDSRTTKGSIDDYWVQYESAADDPYITGAWTQHAWGDAIGDYMKTSQSAYGNTDGSTSFYTWTSSSSQLTCADMVTEGISNDDGTYGRKLFYEARGYTVTDCYNQKTDNNGGGFTYAMYKAEINAGRPVMINLQGHTVVGVGYDDATNSVTIHDTWDRSDHTFTWGTNYSGMTLLSVSIVNLAMPVPPAAFNKASPANGSSGLSSTVTLSWGSSTGATSYQYCVDTSDNAACNTTWVNAGTNTSVQVSGQSLGLHSWQVRATNGSGSTYANSNTWWTFTVTGIVRKIYLPLVQKPVPPPGSFNKTSPNNGATGVGTAPTLTWGASSGATTYQYCFDKTNDNACNGTGGAGGTASWTSVAANTSIALSGLTQNADYFWQVRANNSGGYTDANNGAWWKFTTTTGCSSPKPGFWESSTGDEFYVNPTCNQVLNFAIYISVSGCGDIKITRMTPVNISGNSFSFTGTFFGNGTFDSATQVHGTDGLDNYYIYGCGYIKGGPWAYTANWTDSSQPSAPATQEVVIATLVSAADMPANVHIAEIR